MWKIGQSYQIKHHIGNIWPCSSIFFVSIELIFYLVIYFNTKFFLLGKEVMFILKNWKITYK